jgi:hypothetical protein
VSERLLFNANLAIFQLYHGICLLFTMFILDLFIFYYVYFLQCLFKICLLFTMFILDLYSIKEETDTDLYSNRR